MREESIIVAARFLLAQKAAGKITNVWCDEGVFVIERKGVFRALRASAVLQMKDGRRPSQKVKHTVVAA